MDLHATSVDLPAIAPDLAERKAGPNWVPVVGTVFFLIDTFLTADGFARPTDIGSRVLVIFIWLVSLAAVALLWLRAAPKFFEQGPLVRVVRVVRVIWVTRAGTRVPPGNGDAIAR
jgi:hypothetical protein